MANAYARKITDEQIIRVRVLLAAGMPQNEVSWVTNIGSSTISLIARGLGRYSKEAVAEREELSRCLYGNRQCGGPVVDGLCVFHAAIEAAAKSANKKGSKP